MISSITKMPLKEQIFLLVSFCYLVTLPVSAIGVGILNVMADNEVEYVHDFIAHPTSHVADDELLMQAIREVSAEDKLWDN